MASGPLDHPGAVRPGEALDEARLATYLRGRLPGFADPLAVRQFPAGYSNLTYFLQAGERQYVLRRPPFGSSVRGAHDMGREFRVLTGLHPVYERVPRALLYCADEEVIGAPFYIMERVQGVILRRRPPAGLDLSPPVMRRIAAAFVDNLAALHAVDAAAAGLADLGRPAGYVARQVSGWTRRYENARTDDIPTMTRIADWLSANQPPERAAALIHNDYKYDNVVLDAADPGRIVAVLDWEMATLGDPLLDLGTTLAYWSEPGDPEALRMFGLTRLPGNFSRREVVERYATASGQALENPLFYYVYGLFKLGGIIQQIYYRYRQGHTADPRFASLIGVVRSCGQLAVAALEKGRIDALS